MNLPQDDDHLYIPDEQWEQAEEHLENELGRSPTREEISDHIEGKSEQDKCEKADYLLDLEDQFDSGNGWRTDA